MQRASELLILNAQFVDARPVLVMNCECGEALIFVEDAIETS
jgi:hypothetical protein